MNEGELKQRIKATRGIGHAISPHNHEFDTAVEPILKIVDEAVKEWPTEKEAEQEYLKRTNLKDIKTGLDRAGVWLVLKELRDNWFYKWFGDRND